MDNDTRSHPRKSLHTLAIAALIDGIVAAIAMIAIGSFVKLSKDLSPVVTLSPDGTFVGLVICLILALGPLQRALGGAAFNPCDVAVAMSMGKATRKEFCVRVVGQAIGGALGASYTLRLFPPEWQQ
jgi:glycerol uptake facilitator-like aquaporin